MTSPIINAPLQGKHFVIPYTRPHEREKVQHVEVLGLVPGERHTYRVRLPDGHVATACADLLHPVH